MKESNPGRPTPGEVPNDIELDLSEFVPFNERFEERGSGAEWKVVDTRLHQDGVGMIRQWLNEAWYAADANAIQGYIKELHWLKRGSTPFANHKTLRLQNP